MNKISRPAWLLALLFYVVYFLVMPSRGCDYDMDCWAQWAQFIYNQGLGNAYGSGTNYLPGHLYEMRMYSMLFHSPEDVVSHIYYLKYFTLLFDVAGALLVCSLVKSTGRQCVAIALVMLNPGYLHNNIFWGQFDSVFSTFAFASFLALYNRKFLFAAVLYLISLNFKLQAIIFFPVLVLMGVYLSGSEFPIGKIIRGCLILAGVELLILLPFIIHGQAHKVWQTAFQLGGGYGYISLNASTAWHWLVNGGDLRWMRDRVEYEGLPVKRWGLLMVAASFALTLFPLLRAIFLKWKKKKTEPELSVLAAICALCVVNFFYFNSQMHERYTFPAFLFVAALAVLTNKWWIYILFSLAYFLNNEKCLQGIRAFNYDAFYFDYRFSSALYFLTIVFLLHHIYYGASFRYRGQKAED
jgi:Gpi18-like mannosyltransferase